MKPVTLMVQGCTSDAGKSVLVAGICRVLARLGKKVAPFKPQNMALNSAVTSDGGEIGRAQALQAQACGIVSHTDMNPILLKPSSDTGAQVIVQGRAISSMEAASFHDYKKVAMDAVLESYHRLKQQYDFIIVEGAGSPAEINLRENDIANMGFAEAVDCPVIIIAVIDKGGVFAHLVGTLNLLSSSEQQRVIGFVINRFRGDIKLLESGLDWLEEKTHKSVFGVIPYLKNFYLDAEDAITVSSDANLNQALKPSQVLKVIVPVFSRISNHTDFDALQLHPNVDVEFIAPGKRLPPADLIILPGTKNARKDLALLKEYNWDMDIKKHLRYGGKVIGICGGYQMLGITINDQYGVEDEKGIASGLGLFNIETELEQEKIVTEAKASLFLNDKCSEISAYEIHCGSTKLLSDYKVILKLENSELERSEALGIVSEDNAIIGTYLHGLFDSAEACNEILEWAGLTIKSAININDVREQQLNRLADCLELSLGNTFFENLIRGKYEVNLH